MKRKILTDFVKEVFVTPGSDSEWFGYYNYDPLSTDHTRLLCHRTTHEAVAPEKGMTVEVGYYEIQKEEWHRIGISDSWNWPQAASAQWLSTNGKDDSVIYNASENNHNIAVIHDIQSSKDRKLDWSIYGITPDSKKSIAIDMERAHWCRTYHYQSVSNESLNVPIAEGDGIFEIDLVHNTRRCIVAIQDVIAKDADSNFLQLKHWVEHVMISPSGEKFAFLHRFSPIDSPMQYQTRLCIANIDGSNLKVVKGWRDYSLSHFGWKSNDEFCIYSVKIPALQKQFLSSIKTSGSKPQGKIGLKSRIIVALKNVIPPSIRSYLKGGRSANFYQFYKLQNDEYLPTFRLDKPAFNIDGHPSFTKDGRFMITDTYADKKGWRHLYAYNIETGKEVELAKFYEPLVGNPARCDLHPKLSRDNNYVTVDTTNTGKHGMEVYRINWAEIINATK